MKLIALSIFLLLIGSGAGAYWVWRDLNNPTLHTESDTVFTVARGESTDAVLTRMEALGVIKQKLPLKLYLKLRQLKNDRATIKAGEYRFFTPITPIEAIKALEQGSREHERFTIVEGATIFDVADALVDRISLKVAGSAEAMALLSDTSLITSIDPQARNLEGYLFPDTYFIESDTDGRTLVKQMVERFKDVFESHLAAGAREAGLDAHKVVTVASIVETEAKLSSERPMVASVIYNRMRKGMRLGVDSTIVYAAKLAGKWRDDGKVYRSDINRKSPYNTRLVVGLPPGPVGNPGLSSLKAAVNPASTNYLYYVRDPDREDGTHSFYATSQGFDRGVKKLRRWERQQRKAGLR